MSTLLHNFPREFPGIVSKGRTLKAAAFPTPAGDSVLRGQNSAHRKPHLEAWGQGDSGRLAFSKESYLLELGL